MTVAVIVCLLVTLLLGLRAVQGGRLFVDTDDQMRAVQILDFLSGTGWFDLRQVRLDPPTGVGMHWSRLPDLPVVALVLLLRPFLGQATALDVAGAMVPPVLLLGLFATMARAARPVLGRTREPLAILVTAFTAAIMVQFAPGRIDHHNWQLLLSAIGFGCCLRLTGDPSRRLPAVLAGAGFGLGLWIGTESIPWIAAASAAIAIRWTWAGDRSAGAGVTLAGALCLTVLLIVPVALPPARYTEIACDAFSLTSLVLAGTVLLFFVSLALAERRVVRPGGRVLVCAAAGALALGALLALLPACRGGPYGAVDPLLAEVWLSRVREAQPLLALLQSAPEDVPMLVGLPLLGLAVSLGRLLSERGAAGWTWPAITIHLVIGLVLTIWQVRGAMFANFFAAVPVAWLVARSWDRIEERWQGWRQPVGRLATLMPVLVLPWTGMFAVPAILAPAPSQASNGGTGTEREDCRLTSLDARLADRQGGTATIAAPIDLGAHILLETRHKVLAAPYHRNTAGNLDVYRLFTATTDDEARAVIDRRSIDYVLFCRGASDLKLFRKPGGGSFFDRLEAGNAPGWLRPVAIPDEPNARLFAVAGPGTREPGTARAEAEAGRQAARPGP